jgi:hypothetical protein
MKILELACEMCVSNKRDAVSIACLHWHRNAAYYWNVYPAAFTLEKDEQKGSKSGRSSLTKPNEIKWEAQT